GKAKISSAVRAEIQVVLAAVAIRRALIKHTRPIAVRAEARPEFEGDGGVTRDQSARKIHEGAARPVENDLTVADNGGALQRAIRVANRIVRIAGETVTMGERRSSRRPG